MGIKIVRTPSETPNITNVDDIIPFRYAYGNQNGYVIGRGSQLDGSYESGEFTVGSGRAVIQGVEVDIDANGISTTLDTASETRYFKIYLKVNLANEVTELESYYSTVSYDEITDPTSGDLISGGNAYLLLYTLQLNGTAQVNIEKKVKQIEYNIGENSRLLWSGNVFVNTTSIVDIGQVNIINKIVEIAVTDAGENVRYFKAKLARGNTPLVFNYMPSASNTSSPEIVYMSFTVLNSILKTQIFKTKYSLGSGSINVTAYPCRVLSIREIIE